MAVEPRNSPSSAGPTPGKPYALLVLLQVHWFVRLRWLFAAGALAALAVERFATPTAQRPWPLVAVVLGVAAINVVWTVVSHLWRSQLEDSETNQRVAIRNGQLFVSVQIAIDLLLLTWILALSGGVENPMSLFYLFHIAISGLLLRTWQAIVQSCWAALLYAAMAITQAVGWLTYHPFLPQLPLTGLYHTPEYVALIVVVDVLAVFGTLYFTDRIGRVLDQREDMLIRTNAALERSRQAIQDLQRRRSRFMQTAAHQLKSPLALVQTLASLIREGIVAEPQSVLATTDKIIRRCHEGLVQVTELLALARVQEADPRRHRESPSDVGQVIEAVCAQYAPAAAGKHLQFTRRIPVDEELVAQVHPTDLRDCSANLIENAIKYTPDGGRVRVTVARGDQTRMDLDLPPPPARPDARALADYVFVVVEDTGIGLRDAVPISANGAPAEGTIFDAFRRGEAAILAGIPGSGLGLSPDERLDKNQTAWLGQPQEPLNFLASASALRASNPTSAPTATNR